MGFNSAFKGLILLLYVYLIRFHFQLFPCFSFYRISRPEKLSDRENFPFDSHTVLGMCYCTRFADVSAM